MKRKLLLFSIFLFINFVVALSSISLKTAEATECSVGAYSVDSKKGTEEAADSSDEKIELIIKTSGLVIHKPNDPDVNLKYRVYLKPARPGGEDDGGGRKVRNQDGSIAEFEITDDGTILVPSISQSGYIFPGGKFPGFTFPVGDYEIRVLENGENNGNNFQCRAPFKIKSDPEGDKSYCSIKFRSIPDDYTNEGLVGFKVEFTPPRDQSSDPDNKNYEHRVILKNSYGQILNLDNSKYTTKLLVDGATLSRFLSDGGYTIEVRERAVDFIFGDEGRSCTGAFRIGENGGPGCIGGVRGDRQCKALGEQYLCLTANDDSGLLTCRIPEKGEAFNPCNPENNADGPYTCNTAIGPITTDPGGFIKNVLVLILSLSGGIIILLIIVNGYKLIVSQGDPEKVKEARESVTSAIAGLLLIIFSLAILQFITHDVLHLPGFE